MRSLRLFQPSGISRFYAVEEIAGTPMLLRPRYAAIASVELGDLARDDDPDAFIKVFKDEAAVLKRWLELSEDETALKRAVKEQEAALDKLAYEKYPALTEAEIKKRPARYSALMASRILIATWSLRSVDWNGTRTFPAPTLLLVSNSNVFVCKPSVSVKVVPSLT